MRAVCRLQECYHWRRTPRLLLKALSDHCLSFFLFFFFFFPFFPLLIAIFFTFSMALLVQFGSLHWDDVVLLLHL